MKWHGIPPRPLLLPTTMTMMMMTKKKKKKHPVVKKNRPRACWFPVCRWRRSCSPLVIHISSFSISHPLRCSLSGEVLHSCFLSMWWCSTSPFDLCIRERKRNPFSLYLSMVCNGLFVLVFFTFLFITSVVIFFVSQRTIIIGHHSWLVEINQDRSAKVQSSDQSIGAWPRLCSAVFTREKHLQLANLLKESGDGWAVLMIVCFLPSISFSFEWAKPPQSRKTKPARKSASNSLERATVLLMDGYLAVDRIGFWSPHRWTAPSQYANENWQDALWKSVQISDWSRSTLTEPSSWRWAAEHLIWPIFLQRTSRRTIFSRSKALST